MAIKINLKNLKNKIMITITMKYEGKKLAKMTFQSIKIASNVCDFLMRQYPHLQVRMKLTDPDC